MHLPESSKYSFSHLTANFDKCCLGAQDCGELCHTVLLQRWSPDLTLSTWDGYQPIHHWWQSQLKAFILLLSVRWLGLQVLTNCCLARLIFPCSLTLLPSPTFFLFFFGSRSIPISPCSFCARMAVGGLWDANWNAGFWGLEGWGYSTTPYVRLNPCLSRLQVIHSYLLKLHEVMRESSSYRTGNNVRFWRS